MRRSEKVHVSIYVYMCIYIHMYTYIYIYIYRERERERARERERERKKRKGGRCDERRGLVSQGSTPPTHTGQARVAPPHRVG